MVFSAEDGLDQFAHMADALRDHDLVWGTNATRISPQTSKLTDLHRQIHPAFASKQVLRGVHQRPFPVRLSLTAFSRRGERFTLGLALALRLNIRRGVGSGLPQFLLEDSNGALAPARARCWFPVSAAARRDSRRRPPPAAPAT